MIPSIGRQKKEIQESWDEIQENDRKLWIISQNDRKIREIVLNWSINRISCSYNYPKP